MSIASPSATRAYVAGGAILPAFTCAGFEVTSCSATPTKPPNTEGTHTFTVTATDKQGKVASASVTYTVGESPFGGFGQPINGTGPTSIFRKGSTVPVMFRLVARRHPDRRQHGGGPGGRLRCGAVVPVGGQVPAQRHDRGDGQRDS